MSNVDTFLLFWVLPSLIAFLLSLQSIKKGSKCTIESMDGSDWAAGIIFSIIYPLGILIMLYVDVWPWLIKERSLTKRA